MTHTIEALDDQLRFLLPDLSPTIEVTPLDEPLNDNAYRARLVVPNPDNDYHLRNISYTYSAEGYTEQDAVSNLHRVVREKYWKAIAEKVRKVLPYPVRRVVDQLADTWLSTTGTVLVGSGDRDNVALSELQREYYREMRSTARDILQRVKDGELQDRDDVQQAIHENEVIYTSDAMRTLLISRYVDRYFEEFGGDEPEWCAIAQMAQAQDIQEYVDQKLEEIIEKRDGPDEDTDEGDEDADEEDEDASELDQEALEDKVRGRHGD